MSDDEKNDLIDIDRDLDDTIARIEADQHDRSDEEVGEHMQDGHEPVEQPIDDEIEFEGGETGDGEATEWPPEDADMTLVEALRTAPSGAIVYTDRCSNVGDGPLIGDDVTINAERRPGEGSETRTATMTGFEAGLSDTDVNVGFEGELDTTDYRDEAHAVIANHVIDPRVCQSCNGSTSDSRLVRDIDDNGSAEIRFETDCIECGVVATVLESWTIGKNTDNGENGGA
jgi:hypothetical protein